MTKLLQRRGRERSKPHPAPPHLIKIRVTAALLVTVSCGVGGKHGTAGAVGWRWVWVAPASHLALQGGLRGFRVGLGVGACCCSIFCATRAVSAATCADCCAICLSLVEAMMCVDGWRWVEVDG